MIVYRKISEKDVANSNGQLTVEDIGKNTMWEIDCPLSEVDEENLISSYDCRLLEILTDEELYGF